MKYFLAYLGSSVKTTIYYHNITSTIFSHAVSKKTLVEACQINSITNQILHIIGKKQQQHQKFYLHDHKGITVLQKLLV